MSTFHDEHKLINVKCVLYSVDSTASQLKLLQWLYIYEWCYILQLELELLWVGLQQQKNYATRYDQ